MFGILNCIQHRHKLQVGAATCCKAMLAIVDYAQFLCVEGQHIGEQGSPQLVHCDRQADRAVLGWVGWVALFVQHHCVAARPGRGGFLLEPHDQHQLMQALVRCSR